MTAHDPMCPVDLPRLGPPATCFWCEVIARVRADERERHGNNCRGMWDEWVHDLRAQVEALPYLNAGAWVKRRDVLDLIDKSDG